jgi:hypothetical protein
MADVESLLEERRGYVTRGLKARVAQVDAELAKLGFAVEESPGLPGDVETAETKPARSRRA